jgi:glycosyltransferase involved in cell wall biosynthesis
LNNHKDNADNDKNLDEDIPSLKDIFYSRELFINNNNLTNEYIRFLRPINEEEEKIYHKALYPDLQFNDLYNTTRADQYDFINYYKLSVNHTLLDKKIYTISEPPFISIVLPSFNKEKDLLRTIRSIQNQSLKNIEIIIVDDCSTDNSSEIFKYLLDTEPRVRVFHHLKNMGCWRSRLDGFLYSRGKYILHYDMGDILIDNYVLEDVNEKALRYKLDSVRFSFRWIRREDTMDNFFKIFPPIYTRIRYGFVFYRLAVFGYGTIWNRLTRANIFSKGLNLVGPLILNAYKNLWEDGWWNELANTVSFSHLTINRIGYMYFPSYLGEGMLKVNTEIRKEKAIKEFIYFWLFDYELCPKNDKKKKVINALHDFLRPDNAIRGKIVLISYLKKEFPIYEILLNRLLNDTYVEPEDKKFVNELLANYTIIKNNANKNLTINI